MLFAISQKIVENRGEKCSKTYFRLVVNSYQMIKKAIDKDRVYQVRNLFPLVSSAFSYNDSTYAIGERWRKPRSDEHCSGNLQESLDHRFKRGYGWMCSWAYNWYITMVNSPLR